MMTIIVIRLSPSGQDALQSVTVLESSSQNALDAQVYPRILVVDRL